MGILFIVALILAWPTFGLSVVAYVALLMVRSYLRQKKKVDGMMRRAEFRSLMEPLFQGRSEEFFLALDIPTRLGREFTQEEARECMRHVMYFLADNPNEAALFMRGLENRRAKSGDAGLDPISAALYERNRNLKGEIHLLVYRAIATIKTANPSLRCFDKVDVAELCLRIVDVSTSPPAAGRQLGIAPQLGEELLQARWIALLKRIGRDEATRLLSSTQALDAALIQRFESSWDWEQLSANETLPWSLELIERYKDRWNWYELSSNEALPWSLDLIERFENRWEWVVVAGSGLSSNEALPWSLELIERFENRWIWWALSSNKALPWSLELIERFEDRWQWRWFSENEALPWSLELIERYEDRWDWGELDRVGLSGNTALPWSRELIDRYENRWEWWSLSANKALPWSLELIERFEDRWQWLVLSTNEALPWSLELIERYGDRWNWAYLSNNKALPWSLELIERYENRWEWEVVNGSGLSSNEALPWSLELIERFEDRWIWWALSLNKALPWSLELIERYKDQWDWSELSTNKALPWSLELIERNEDRWDWKCLSKNETLPWALELIERFQDRWDWDRVREVLRRTKVLALSSSSIDGLMAHFAYPKNEKAESLLNKRQRGEYMTSSKISVIEYAGGESFVVMHNGKRIEIALDFDLPAAIAGHAPDKPKIREFLPSRADQHISTHPIYECSNEDRDLILAACDEAVTRHLSSLSDKP